MPDSLSLASAYSMKRRMKKMNKGGEVRVTTPGADEAVKKLEEIRMQSMRAASKNKPNKFSEEDAIEDEVAASPAHTASVEPKSMIAKIRAARGGTTTENQDDEFDLLSDEPIQDDDALAVDDEPVQVQENPGAKRHDMLKRIMAG